MGRTEVAELRKEVEAVQADNKRLITTKGKLQVDLEVRVVLPFARGVLNG